MWVAFIALFGSVSTSFYNKEKFWRTVSELGEISDDNPHGAIFIYLNRNKLSTIRANSFPFLGQSVELDLSESKISELEPGAFNGLRKLRIMKLFVNRLTHLKAGVFSNLTALEELQLDRNWIETIENGTFHGLDSLKALWLHQNKLTTLHPDLFAMLPRPLELAISAPHVPEIRDNPLQCDQRLCWLKKEEVCETITWRNDWYGPRCAVWSTLECLVNLKGKHRFNHLKFKNYMIPVFNVRPCLLQMHNVNQYQRALREL